MNRPIPEAAMSRFRLWTAELRLSRAAICFAAAGALCLLALVSCISGAGDGQTGGKALKPYTQTIPGTSISFEMVPIPGGRFRMGSPEGEVGRNVDEGPQVEVEIEPFWMARCEVTWAQYRQYMAGFMTGELLWPDNKKNQYEKHLVDAVTHPTPVYHSIDELGDDPNHPAVMMTQFAARQFTKWLSRLTGHTYRLPTEAEWEYACRAGTRTAYYFGDDPARLGEYEWYLDNASDTYHKVGLKKPNPWGLHDMLGNVSEWTLDGYESSGYYRLIGRTVPWRQAVIWPSKEHDRVIRGGHFFSEASGCRVALKLPSEPSRRWSRGDENRPSSPHWHTEPETQAISFRIVRQIRPPTAEEQVKFWEADVESIKEAVSDRFAEGRGAMSIVTPDLPRKIVEAIEAVKKRQKQ